MRHLGLVTRRHSGESDAVWHPCDVRDGGQIWNKNIWHLSRLARDLGRTVYKSLYYSPIKTEIYVPKCALFKHYTFIKYGNPWKENSNDLTLSPSSYRFVFLGHASSVGWHCILYFKIGTCLKKRIHQNQYWQSRGWHPMFMPRPSPGFTSTGPGPRLENEYISQTNWDPGDE